MGATLNMYSPCSWIFEEIGVQINEDLQVCYGSMSMYPTGTCRGDSGGPLVAVGTNGQAIFLIGVTLFGERTATDPMFPFPSVFTRTDYYANWIEESLRTMRFASDMCSTM